MRKNGKIIIAIMLFSLFSIIGINNVNAERIHYTECTYPLKGNLIEKYAVKNDVTIDLENNDHFTAYASNGHIVYCIEKGVHQLNDYNTLDGPDYVSYDAKVDSNILDRVLSYGYSGEDSSTDPKCSTDRAATQLVVWFASKEVADKTTEWRKLTKSQLIEMSNTDIGTKAYNLIQLVLNHDKVPSFAKSTSDSAANADDRVVLKYNPDKYNFSATLTDENSILSTWKLGTPPSKITVSIDGNKMTITSASGSVTTPIELSKTIKANTTGYTRKHPTYQDTSYVIPKNQTIKSYVGYQYELIGKGSIAIHKIDKYTSENMQGATFGIFSDSSCKTRAKDYLGNELKDKTTDKNGFLGWNNLYYPISENEEKIYYVKETKQIDGYSIDNSQMDVLGAGENACVPIVIKEKDEFGKPEDRSSEASKNIGIYNEEVQTIYNIPYGNITILKQDVETTKAIEGVEFKILKYNKDKSPAININGEVVKNVTTNKLGVAEFENLPYGDYIIEEVKGTDSYKILKEPVVFTLNKDTDALKYKSQGTDSSLLPVVSNKEKFTYTVGDVNADKKIDNSDLEILTKALEGDKSVTTYQKYASDVNLDGKLNNTDKDLMTKYIGGDTTAFVSKEVEVATDDVLPLETYKLGDPTNDGKIDELDLKVIEKIIELTSKEKEVTEEKVEISKLEEYASDVSLDGVVDTHDKELMISYIGGNKAAFDGLKEIAYPEQFQKRVSLVVTNVPIDIKISKQAITNSKELKGAEIVIKTKDGKVFHKYISDGKEERFYIPIGEYTLVETVAPEGYETLKTEVEFKVESDGNIKLLSAKSNMYKLTKSEGDLDHLIIYNNLKKIKVPDTASQITFIAVVIGTALVSLASYEIYRKYKIVN